MANHLNANSIMDHLEGIVNMQLIGNVVCFAAILVDYRCWREARETV